MRCARVRRSLSAFLDGEVPAAEQQQIAAHLGGCAGCRSERDALAATWESLLAWPDSPVRPGFDARLRRRLGAVEAAPVPWHHRLLRTLWIPARRLALAGVLAGIATGWLLGRVPTPAALTSSDAGSAALRREVSRAFSLDMLTEVPPESAGAPYVTLTGCGRNAR